MGMAVFRLNPSPSGTTTSALSPGQIATQSIWMEYYPSGRLSYSLVVSPGQPWPNALPDEGTNLNINPPTSESVSGEASISDTGTIASVASSTNAAVLLASNTLRSGATVYNDSTANLFIGLGFVPTLTEFTLKMGSGGYFELPYSFVGTIGGIWDAANGFARVTEIS
jgi:hypothetical protein